MDLIKKILLSIIIVLITYSCDKIFTKSDNGSKDSEPINVALQSNGASASAISEGSYGGIDHPASLAIDGDKDTQWASDWSMPAWVIVEFDKIYTIDKVAVWWWVNQHTFSISLSENGTTWATVVPSRLSNNPGFNYETTYEEYPITPRSAKYIKIEMTTTNAPSSYIFQAILGELEAYAIDDNKNPEIISTPNLPDGNSAGDTGVSYAYSTGGSTSSDGHSLEYQFDWGDSTYSGWSSNTNASHAWNSAKTYNVRARSRCSIHTNILSYWSDSKSVEITDPNQTIVNVALQSNGGTASAISEGSYGGIDHPASLAIDGDKDTQWASQWSMPAWVIVEFDKIYTIDKVAVWWWVNQHTFSISLSENGSTWTTVVPSRLSNNPGFNYVTTYEQYPITPRSAKYIKIDMTTTNAPSGYIFQAILGELEAYGD